MEKNSLKCQSLWGAFSAGMGEAMVADFLLSLLIYSMLLLDFFKVYCFDNKNLGPKALQGSQEYPIINLKKISLSSSVISQAMEMLSNDSKRIFACSFLDMCYFTTASWNLFYYYFMFLK